MLKGAEYVDPILAQKIVNLERQLGKIQSTKREILNNAALQPSTKNKLLQYQTECQQNIQTLLDQERDKLAEYFDQQTNVLTKDNRKSQTHHHKNSFTLNQSTRIDISTDDGKSFQATRKSQAFTKSINSIHFKYQSPQKQSAKKCANKQKVKVRRLKKKVSLQQKMINMLVLWVKIYYEREQSANKTNTESLMEQYQRIEQQNKRLKEKCNSLQFEIQSIKNDFKMSSQRALETHRKRQLIRQQNKTYELQRKQLINTVRSLQKIKNTKLT